MIPRCIAVDFDSTLARFVGGKKDLFAIFIRRGISESSVKEAYEESKRNGGFTIQKLQKLIEEKVKKAFDSCAIVQEFDEWVKNTVLPYPDSIPAISRWKVLHIPVAIVTYGDPDFQKKKIAITGIPYDRLHIVTVEDGKSEELRKLLARYGQTILFIDDKPSVLDGVRENGIKENEVITVLIRRQDSPYVHDLSQHHHIEISYLDEIDKTIMRTSFPVLQR